RCAEERPAGKAVERWRTAAGGVEIAAVELAHAGIAHHHARAAARRLIDAVAAGGPRSTDAGLGHPTAIVRKIAPLVPRAVAARMAGAGGGTDPLALVKAGSRRTARLAVFAEV